MCVWYRTVGFPNVFFTCYRPIDFIVERGCEAARRCKDPFIPKTLADYSLAWLQAAAVQLAVSLTLQIYDLSFHPH